MTLEDVLNNWLVEQRNLILSNYENSGMRASGKFANELNSSVKSNITSIKGTIEGASHGYFMEHGRGATKTLTAGNPTLKQIIRKWIDDKGITPNNISKDSLAFLISRKIHREGWKPKNVYPNGIISSVLNDVSINKLLLNLLTVQTAKIKSEILDEFNDFK